MIRISRREAVQLAEFERDALLFQARQSGSCAPLWIKAAEAADIVVASLEREDDQIVLEAAKDIARKWRAAAECGAVNIAPIDTFTLGHAAVGSLLGLLGLRAGEALIFAVGWEMAERPLKVRYPTFFPRHTQDSPTNSIVDVVATMIGWWVGSTKK